MECSNTPVQLVLATTDPELYNIDTEKWTWSGTLFWSVQCLPSGQDTVSDSHLPKLTRDEYLPIDKTPTNWNYCKSKNCGVGADTMHVIFTFNPDSTDPKDYLQYVVDIHCHVTDYPSHTIKDSDGNDVYFDIIQMMRMSMDPYVEFWIEKSNVIANPVVPSIIKPAKKETSSWIYYIIFGVLFLLVVAAIYFGITIHIDHNNVVKR